MFSLKDDLEEKEERLNRMFERAIEAPKIRISILKFFKIDFLF
jgi:hypothetical protein